MRRFNTQIILSALCIFILSGCAAKRVPPSGFLNDYSRFKESGIIKGLMVDKSSDRGLGAYSKFIIAPVMMVFAENTHGNKVDPAELNELANYIKNGLTKALSEQYEIVEEPSAETAIIRIALTDVVPNIAALNLHWSTKAAGMGIGGASLEAEFVDSVSGERILAVIDTRKGPRFDLKRYHKGLTKWGSTKIVFDEWIEMLTSRLDELHQ